MPVADSSTSTDRSWQAPISVPCGVWWQQRSHGLNPHSLKHRNSQQRNTDGGAQRPGGNVFEVRRNSHPREYAGGPLNVGQSRRKSSNSQPRNMARQAVRSPTVAVPPRARLWWR